MKKLWVSLAIGVLMLATVVANAADTKVNGRLYADWRLNTSDGADSENSFNLTRAYVTVKSKLSDYTAVRITSDIRSTDAFDGYDVTLKYAYIDWMPKFANDRLTVRFGLHPTPYIDVMNKIWNRRYLEKTVSDKYKYLTSSDLGAALILGLGENNKLGSLEFHVFNGSSYSDVEEMNKQKDFNFYGEINPLLNNADFKRTKLIGQAYLGTQNVMIDSTEEASQYKNQLISFGGVLGYRNTFDLGGEVNFHTMGEGYTPMQVAIEDTKSSGMAFFGTLYFEDLVAENSSLRTLNLFGRYDIVDPNTDVDNDGMNLMIAGIECVPVKGFKASVNYRVTSFEDDSADSESYIYVNTLFKF